MLNISELRAARAEHARTTAALQNLARRISQIRTGDELHPEFQMHSYRETTFDAAHIEADDEDAAAVVYPIGTPVMVVNLYHHRWGDDRDVIFPAAYLDGTENYVTAEIQAVAERRVRAEQAEANRKAVAEAAAFEQRRAAYERLKIEFYPTNENTAQSER